MASKPVCCPGCGEHFRASPSESVPIAFSCGHSLCAPCADAILLTPVPTCIICNSLVQTSHVNLALAEFAEVSYLEQQQDCGEPNRNLHTEMMGMATASGDAGPTKRARVDDSTEQDVELPPQGRSRGLSWESLIPDLVHHLRRVQAHCQRGATYCNQSVANLEEAKKRMISRKDASVASAASAVAAFKLELDAALNSAVFEANAICQERCKALDAQIDELMISSSQLGTASAMCEAQLTSDDPHAIERTLRSVQAASKLYTPFKGPRVSTMIELLCSMDALRAALASFSKTRTQVKPVVGGHGLSTFRGVDESSSSEELSVNKNVIEVTCTDECGELITTLSPADVDVRVEVPIVSGKPSGNAAVTTLTQIAPGIFNAFYTVAASAFNEVRISVRVCSDSCANSGPWIAYNKPFPIGTHLRTYGVLGGKKCGFAVSRDQRFMALSAYGCHGVWVYQLDTGALVAALGSSAKSAERGGFALPYRLAFSPRNSLLVCEWGNHRVQEVSLDGRHVRFLGTPFKSYRGVACHGDLIAFSTEAAPGEPCIELYSWSTGAMLAAFGTRGEGPGCLGQTWDVSFASEGRHIVVPQWSSAQLLHFSAVSGECVSAVSLPMLTNWQKGVAVTATGDIVLADMDKDRIAVFTRDGETLLRAFHGSNKDDLPPQFPGVELGVVPAPHVVLKQPTAVAIVCGRLFVMDATAPHVHVYC